MLPVLQDMPVIVGPGLYPSQPHFAQVMVPGADGKLHDTYFYGDPESSYFMTPDLRERAAIEVRRLSSTFSDSLGQLLCGFFWDLAMNDWRRNVSSIRTGGFILKSQKAAEDSWRLHPRCSIEDPFETSYDVGHVLRDGTFRNIRAEAMRAYAILSGCHCDLALAPLETCFAQFMQEVPHD